MARSSSLAFFLRGGAAFGLQCGLVLAVLGVVLTLPPVAGPMLVVPIVPRSIWTWLPIGGDVRLIAAGPVAGSWIIAGRRDRLWAMALRQGAIVVAADPVLCGSAGGR